MADWNALPVPWEGLNPSTPSARDSAKASNTTTSLPPWLSKAAVGLGMQHPTAVQVGCVGAGLGFQPLSMNTLEKHEDNQENKKTKTTTKNSDGPDVAEEEEAPFQLDIGALARGGPDIVAAAPTGSGKTAAFALPILAKLAKDPFGVFALVLTPSRELAFQICESFNALGATVPAFRCLAVVGGRDMVAQATALQRRPHVVVATPGRFVDHIRSNRLNSVFSNLRYVVLDEADKMLQNDGLKTDVLEIFRALPQCAARLTLGASGSDDEHGSVADSKGSMFRPNALGARMWLFSATMTLSKDLLAEFGVTNPYRFAVDDRTLETVRGLDQQYMFMADEAKDCYLTYVLRMLEEDEESEEEDPRSRRGGKKGEKKKRKTTSSKLSTTVIIFTATCLSAQTIHETLKRLGIPSVPLHSELPMRDRLASIGAFKSNQVQVLVATDVAGRGLDIPSVGLVINYNVPRDPSDYVHRVGRTARAGRDGESLTLITPLDVGRVHRIEAEIGKKLTEREADEDTVLRHLTETTTAKALANIELRDKDFGERKASWRRKAEKDNSDEEPKKKKRRKDSD